MAESRMKENCLNKILSPYGYSFALGLILYSTSLVAASAEELSLKEETNFQNLRELMQQSNQVVLVAFVADYCGYCRQLEKDQLKPLLKAGHYKDHILIRTVDIANTHTLLDFQGKPSSPSAFATQYHADITPTLVFLDKTGQEVAERLVGYNSPDFYGAYLERSIQQAIKHQSTVGAMNAPTLTNKYTDKNKDSAAHGTLSLN